VEDNNDTEDECNDSDAYNEVPVAEIEQCEITKFQPNNEPPIQRGYDGLPIRGRKYIHVSPIQLGHRRVQSQDVVAICLSKRLWFSSCF
jgi:hypothetical protein